jgi:hypothetical protein
MIGAAAVSVLLLVMAALWAQVVERTSAEENAGRYEGEKGRRKLLPSYLLAFFASFGVAMLAVALAWSMPTIPAGLIAYGRYLPSRTQVADALYVGEGMNSTVAVTLLDGDIVSFHVCGKVEASTEPADMRLQRMLGHLSALLHPKPRSILVVGWGASPRERSCAPGRRESSVRDQAPSPDARAFSARRTTTCCTIRASKSCTTTPGITSSRPTTSST